MIKVEVIEEFTLDRFDELKNIVRKNSTKNQEKHLYVEDTFECTKDMADYLLGGNRLKRAFIKVIEVIPEVKVKEEKEVKTKVKSKKSIAKK